MDEVAALLAALELDQYVGRFDQEGWDDADFLKTMNKEALAEVAAEVGMKPGHQRRFLRYFATGKTSSRGPNSMREVVTALELLKLEQYATAFKLQGWDDLDTLRELTSKELLGVATGVRMKPGHADKFVRHFAVAASGGDCATSVGDGEESMASSYAPLLRKHRLLHEPATKEFTQELEPLPSLDFAAPEVRSLRAAASTEEGAFQMQPLVSLPFGAAARGQHNFLEEASLAGGSLEGHTDPFATRLPESTGASNTGFGEKPYGFVEAHEYYSPRKDSARKAVKDGLSYVALKQAPSAAAQMFQDQHRYEYPEEDPSKSMLPKLRQSAPGSSGTLLWAGAAFLAVVVACLLSFVVYWRFPWGVPHGPTLTFRMRVQNVDYDQLTAQPSLAGAFQEEIRTAVASKAGAGISPEHVAVELSGGSVVAESVITPPSHVDPQSVQSKLNAWYSLNDEVAAGLSGLDGMEDVCTGPISITALSVHREGADPQEATEGAGRGGGEPPEATGVQPRTTTAQSASMHDNESLLSLQDEPVGVNESNATMPVTRTVLPGVYTTPALTAFLTTTNLPTTTSSSTTTSLPTTTSLHTTTTPPTTSRVSTTSSPPSTSSLPGTSRRPSTSSLPSTSSSSSTSSSPTTTTLPNTTGLPINTGFLTTAGVQNVTLESSNDIAAAWPDTWPHINATSLEATNTTTTTTTFLYANTSVFAFLTMNTTTSLPPIKTTVISTSTMQTRCGVAEYGMRYIVPEMYVIPRVPSAEECCMKCQRFPIDAGRCLAWTWEDDCPTCGNHTCFLKGGGNYNAPVQKVPEQGVISGLFQPRDPVPLLEKRSTPYSLYCFALMLPHSYEMELLAMQHERRLSIFACDEPAIYSNVSLEVAPGVNSSIVDSNLHCQVGGEFMTALNTGIFVAVWKRVLEEGRFRNHDWTVKADPDAVWFPSRLHATLEEHFERPNGAYLNNCKFGMHGPIEVLSRNAVEIYGKDAALGNDARCLKEQHWGLWGEDMWLDQCLLKVLLVERDNDFDLICEDHCACPGWERCDMPRIVAFHPFKTVNAYLGCVQTATALDAVNS